MNRKINITSFLTMWLKSAPPAIQEIETEKVVDAICLAADKLKDFRRSADRVRFVWNCIEAEVRETKQDNAAKGHGVPSCRANCNACCHIHVGTNAEEVALLADYVVERQIPVSWQRLRAQVQNEKAHRGEDSRAWMRLPYAERLCPFNGSDRNCSVYAVRPSRCRIYHVYTPPEQCDTSINHDSQALTLLSAGAEITMSAWANVGKVERGSLTELFWKHINEKNLLNRINWTDKA